MITPIDNSFKKTKTEITDIFFDASNNNISHISTELEKFGTISTNLTEADFRKEFGELLPKLSAVYRHFSSISASNSSVDRAYSQFKYIFNDLSGKLSYENIEAQLIACII